MTHIPQEIRINRARDTLTLVYSDTQYFFSAEFLRVMSPSAEVRGHGVGQEVLQTGKRDVRITDLIPVGNYALKIIFSDGHDSGIYDWDYLDEMGQNQTQLWRNYLNRLALAGASRESDWADNVASHTGCSGSKKCSCQH